MFFYPLVGESAANFAQEPAATVYEESAVDFAKKLSCRINLGNSLDVKDMLQHNSNISLAVYEKNWGNPLIANALSAVL